jgi:cardiolipin synthase
MPAPRDTIRESEPNADSASAHSVHDNQAAHAAAQLETAAALAPPAAIESPHATDPQEPHSIEVAGQSLCLFAEAPPLLRRMVADIRTARSRVWLETYIFLNDSGGTAVADALKDRAAAGLDVRLMYDAAGSFATPTAFFSEMAAAGVTIHAYRTFWDGLSRGFKFFAYLNRRNHRKLTVIDDEIAYFGGMNIVNQADAAAAGSTDALPMSAGWRDVHVRLSGPQQFELAESFERSWRRAHHQHVPARAAHYRRGELPNGAAKTPAPWGTQSAEWIRFFDTGPGRGYTRAGRIFRRVLDGASRSVLLSMAYFLPPGHVQKALQRASRRGLDVDVIIPAESDVKLVQWATEHEYADWLEHGVRIHERQQRMLHSKVMVVDGLRTIVGSCNLDPRSLRINLEIFAVVQSRALAAMVTAICDHEIAHSTLVTAQRCGKQRWWQRLRNRAAYTLRRWL